MAKYTIELSSLFMASVTARNPQLSDNYFPPTPLQSLNDDSAVLAFFENNVGAFPYRISEDDTINQKFLVTFERNFLRHFYSLEISQENTLNWFVLLSDFLNSEMPRFIKQYTALDQNDWLQTSVSHGVGTNDSVASQTGTNASNQLNANADTPHNALDFSLDSSDPTKDYNFNYASVVAGAKSTGTNNSDATQKNNSESNANSRNATLMQLITELDTFANGVYLNLWTRATRQYHLFMGVY